MKISILAVSAIFLFFSSCNEVQPDKAKGITDLMEADRAFSALSSEKGMKFSFIEYLDSKAVLLRPNNNPIIGDDAQKYLEAVNDSTFTLTWKPSGADISISGDLGYTFGIYSLKLADTSMQGTYVTIWKKQDDGSWKYVLDSGNEGIGKK